MKRWISLVMGTLFVLWGVAGCNQASAPTGTGKAPTPQTKSQPQSSQGKAQPTTQQTGAKPQSQHPAGKTDRGPWPYLGSSDQREDLAENLTAKNFLVIFDGSGSMTETECADGKTKISVAKAAVAEWSETVAADANIGLVSFNHDGWTRLKPEPRNREQFIRVTNGINAGGRTPLTEAFQQAYIMLTAQARKQLGYGEYTIVVITDGIADDPTSLSKVVSHVLVETPIVIHTIGFCISGKHSLNQAGRTYYRTATDPKALRKGLQEVLAEAESFDVTRFTR